MSVVPFSLKDAPALIERLLPVQKLSAEAYKEQMAGSGKTLTALGSYWKGRKPLVLNKACILGCLLPATNDPTRDLAVFEMLMGMDDESLAFRAREDADPTSGYRARVHDALRAEEVGDAVHAHIWDDVNAHLGTEARTFPELVEQLGLMRFGHRPRVADTFCGSGQIPFEAARLGCNVLASDLNPIACMLTWGAVHVVGASRGERDRLKRDEQRLLDAVKAEIDRLGVECDGNGWRAKVFLYCAEVRCPQTGWMVPLLPSLVVSRPRSGVKINVVVDLVPDLERKRYDILIRRGASDAETSEAERQGTVRSDGRGRDPYMIHWVEGVEYRTKISTLRGDYRMPDGRSGNRLRAWEPGDIGPRPDDVFQERLYCIQWMRRKRESKRDQYEFRAVTEEDLERERRVEAYVASRLLDWQQRGYVPDMRIEAGDKTDEPIRTRGWTHWHHLFNPRQLLVAGLVRRGVDARLVFGLCRLLNANSRLSRWDTVSGGGGCVQGTFDNQALNTLLTYGCRSFANASELIAKNTKSSPLPSPDAIRILSSPAEGAAGAADVVITDPPYGDAVKYEEILEFFIAWLRKNPPPEFADWIWDSRRAIAIRGEGEGFRRSMVAAYTRMTQCMPDNGIQVIMFVHQSGAIWADMANIVWASGLQVTAAWYVVTETDSALREGSYVKGTVLLVLSKRAGKDKSTRDDLAWEIKEEVEQQVASLTGLNQQARALYHEENVFEDADIQMAGYAAALRVLTRYAIIDGRDMTAEAIRPRVKGETTFVDKLIAFAVETANQCLVPQGLDPVLWDRLLPAERFYLKMLDMEARGARTLDNYQNFAKAFKVRDFKPLLASHRANEARLRSAVEFGRSEMSEGSELHDSMLRGVLYALMEFEGNVDGGDVLAHLALNVPNYYGDTTQRARVTELADYLAVRLEAIRPDEASAARVLRDLVRGQRLG